MRIAFYAPLKPADHAIPSGDRQMARLLIAAMEMAGHKVEVASRLRAFLRSHETAQLDALGKAAGDERRQIASAWHRTSPPDLWLTYHPYYKAPDLLGPALARQFRLPYVTVEASYSVKRDGDGWQSAQSHLVEAVKGAALNICFTARDRKGLEAIVSSERLADLMPFIDASIYDRGRRQGHDGPVHIIAVAMMRRGDKFESFRTLAAALERLAPLDWTLSLIGDGPERQEVARIFDKLPAGRVKWRGEVRPEEVSRELFTADLYAWPGCGEAYGLAYLEAQAAGLPVVAQDTAGVPAVVENGSTGLLSPAGDIAAYAAALERLLVDGVERQRLGANARRFVLGERNLAVAARRLDQLLRQAAAVRGTVLP